jgi:hypothetical protein
LKEDEEGAAEDEDPCPILSFSSALFSLSRSIAITHTPLLAFKKELTEKQDAIGLERK